MPVGAVTVGVSAPLPRAQGFVDAYGDDTDQPATALSCLQARCAERGAAA